MSRLYGPAHRALQDQFDTRELADRIEDVAASPGVEPAARAFIESRDMFFLSTVDARGWPTVSYKGGAPGFVRVLDETTLAFPNYDGNGMYLSMGNADAHPEVGLLFIDFEKPFRLRAQGRATVAADDPLIGDWPGADLVVRVALHAVWQNCPRYIHRYRKLSNSRYVPDARARAPLAGWKRIDGLQDVLTDADRAEAAREGHITEEEWIDSIQRGDPRA